MDESLWFRLGRVRYWKNKAFGGIGAYAEINPAPFLLLRANMFAKLRQFVHARYYSEKFVGNFPRSLALYSSVHTGMTKVVSAIGNIC